MKKIIFFIILISITSYGYSQRNLDIGAFSGTSYYLGDLNPNSLFAQPRYSVGPVFRYNLNSRYSFRMHIIYANIAGEDVEANSNVTRRDYPSSFKANLVNSAIQTEFNFFPYKTYDAPGAWTPYIFGGVGYSFAFASEVQGGTETPTNHLTIPFGVGAKLNFTRRMSGGIEWSHHKTFSSTIDGVISPVGETFLYQNDWYSFFGLFITYKFFKFAADCPVYD